MHRLMSRLFLFQLDYAHFMLAEFSWNLGFEWIMGTLWIAVSWLIHNLTDYASSFYQTVSLPSKVSCQALYIINDHQGGSSSWALQGSSPRTGACAFGKELSAERVCLPQRISGTPEPIRLTKEPFYTAFKGVPHVIARTQRASLSQAASTLLVTGGRSRSVLTQPNNIRMAAETTQLISGQRKLK
jgi:hypothetical protein